MQRRILVLGGGFAGLAAAERLSRTLRRHGAGWTIRLMDRRARAVFSPLLPDLVGGRVRERALAHPLAEHCRRLGVEYRRTTVRGVDPGGCRVHTEEGTVRGDALVLALGCETNYFGDTEARVRVPGLKDLRDGRDVRARTLALLRAETSARRALIVVGGGYTGFELAGQLAVLATRTLGCGYADLGRRCPIVLVERSAEVLRACAPEIRGWALDLIGGLGVDVRTRTWVESWGVGAAVRLSDGTVFDEAAAVWCAGVAPGPAVAGWDGERTAGGRLAVDRYLRLSGAERVFAAGDVAGAFLPGGRAPLRMSVPFAIAGGRCAAENAVRSLTDRDLLAFAPSDPGYVVPLAPGRAAGEVLGRPVCGRLPGVLHYFMCALRSWDGRMRQALIRDLMRTIPRRATANGGEGSP
ncbi:MAG: FAD-dependent oxidoreductase [Candidatus Brocadiaceae bacterium]|nr:FAD-dependent oxidoreductase [Candidatus Brocadiaceae bacterium]